MWPQLMAYGLHCLQGLAVSDPVGTSVILPLLQTVATVRRHVCPHHQAFFQAHLGFPVGVFPVASASTWERGAGHIARHWYSLCLIGSVLITAKAT